MNIVRTIAPILIIAVGVAVFVTMGHPEKAQSEGPSKPESPLVETAMATLHTDGLEIDVDGTVVPHRDVEVPAEVAGRITKKYEACETGEFVGVGTPLFEIDPRDYDLEIRRLKKQLGQAEAELKEIRVQIKNTEDQVKLAEENLELQRKELNRLKAITRPGIVSESEYDEARRSELMARESLLTHTNQLRLLGTRVGRLEAAEALVKVQLDRAELDRKRCTVKSPINGVVIAESVQQDGFAQKGAVLVTIQDTATMEVACNLRVDEVYWVLQQLPPAESLTANERQRRAFHIPDTPTKVVFESVFEWDGELNRLDGVGLDAETRLVPCRVVVKDPLAVKYVGPATGKNQPTGPAALLRNMYVQLKILTKPRTKLLNIPEQSLRVGNTVWVVRDGKLDIVPVKVVKRWDDEVLIDGSMSDINEGAKVVISPLAGARPEMEVREQETK